MDFNEDEFVFRLRRRRSRLLFEDQPYFSRRGTLTSGANQSVGTIVPAGLVFPNDYDQWDFNSTTDLSGVPDASAAIQAAIDLISASGQGGTVLLPPGVIRVDGGTQIRSGGITIRGAGWEEYISSPSGAPPGLRGKRGTYILTTKAAPAPSPFFATNSATDFQMRDLGFIEIQQPDSSFVSPSVYNAAVTLDGSAGNVVIENCLFWGKTQAVQVNGPSGGGGIANGRLLLKDLFIAPYVNGIVISDNGTDLCIIDNVSILPQLLIGNTNMQNYIMANATGISLGNSEAIINNLTVRDTFFGCGFGSTSWNVQKRITLNNVNMRNVVIGLFEAAGVRKSQVVVSNYNWRGSTNSAPSMAIDMRSTGGSVWDVNNMYATVAQGPLIAMEGASGGQDIRLGMTMWLDNWNQSPPQAGFPNPAPAIYVNTGGSLRYPTNGRFTNANGGPNTGGTGTITGY